VPVKAPLAVAYEAVRARIECADFDLAAFEHRAIWNASVGRIEMHLESLAECTLFVADVGTRPQRDEFPQATHLW